MITRHPDNQSVEFRTDVKFSIGATGDNLRFQWQKDGSDLSDGDKYQGVNTDTLHILAVKGSDEGDYGCLVENDVGKLFSDEAVLFGKLLALLCVYVVVICTTKLCKSFWGSNLL